MCITYCSTCKKDDCVCLCAICNHQQPQNQTPFKKTRKTKNKKIDWISCNSCKLWVHPKCTGLLKPEINKINKDNNLIQFFKCLKCSIKAAKLSGINIQALITTDPIKQDIATQTSITSIEDSLNQKPPTRPLLKSSSNLNIQVTKTATENSNNSKPVSEQISNRSNPSETSVSINKDKIIRIVDKISKESLPKTALI